MFRSSIQTYKIADKSLRIRIPNRSHKQEDLSTEALPLFDIVWPSSKILCYYLNDLNRQGALENKRILEVGCGLALPSLYLKSLGADITALDIHPITSKLLAKNLKLNKLDEIPFYCLSWSDLKADPKRRLGKFDLILGSDVLYEPQHIQSLANFLDVHTHAKSEVLIVDPERGQLSQFRAQMLQNGLVHEARTPQYPAKELESYRGVLDHYQRES